VTTGKLAGEFVQGVHGHRLSKLSCNAKRQRVATDTGKVLEQEVSSSYVVARDGQADDFDVMAFPIHLATTSAQGQCSSDGTEIDKSELECCVGGHG
jgi:hypothetical protein